MCCGRASGCRNEREVDRKRVNGKIYVAGDSAASRGVQVPARGPATPRAAPRRESKGTARACPWASASRRSWSTASPSAAPRRRESKGRASKPVSIRSGALLEQRLENRARGHGAGGAARHHVGKDAFHALEIGDATAHRGEPGAAELLDLGARGFALVGERQQSRTWSSGLTVGSCLHAVRSNTS